VDQTPVTTTINDEANPYDPADPDQPNEKDAVFAEISVDKASTVEGTQLQYSVHLVDENGDPVTVPAGKSVEVALSWSGDAAGGDDTSALPSSVTITGDHKTLFTIDALDDVYAEGSEPLVATITGITDTDSSFEAVAVGTNDTANSAITDETDDYNPNDPDQPNEKDNVTISLSGDASVVEGEAASYTLTLTDDAGNPVTATEDMTVDFTYTYVTAEGEDITETATATIAAGSSTGTFTVNSVDDVFAEGAEDYQIAINNVTAGDTQFENLTVDQTPVTTTINDQTGSDDPAGPEDTVYVQLVTDDSGEEGTDLTHTVKLVDAAGNPVTVAADETITVTIGYDPNNNDSATKGTDYTENNAVTITEGNSEATLTVSTTDDSDNEGDESYTAVITNV
jgi:hypothetical protein